MIGLLSAMEEEIVLLKESIEIDDVVMAAGTTFYTGKFEDNRVVLARCGVGKVNAAAVTQLMIDRFEVKAMVFSGLAGSLVGHVKAGDIVVSNYVVQHDVDLTAFGRRRGQVSDSSHLIEADPKLVQLISDACDEVIAEKELSANTVVGTIATGDTFVSDENVIKWLQREFGGVAIEMEGAALGHVCSLNKIPFVVLRIISDSAGGSAASEFIQFLGEASELSSEIVKTFLGKLVIAQLIYRPQVQI